MVLILFDSPLKELEMEGEGESKAIWKVKFSFQTPSQLQSARPQLLHPVLLLAEPCSDTRGGPSPHHQRMPITCAALMGSKAHYGFPKFPWAQSSGPEHPIA